VRELVGRWSWEYLAETMGDKVESAVNFTPRSGTQFSRFYGEGLGKGGIFASSFKDYAARVAANESKARAASKLPSLCPCSHPCSHPCSNPCPYHGSQAQPPWKFYLQTSLCWDETNSGDRAMGTKNVAAGGKLPRASSACGGPVHHACFRKPLVADLDQRVDWRWLAASFQAAGSPLFSSATMWALASLDSTRLDSTRLDLT
jgi:hypothetical protein